jgi:hypothetical protein
MVKYSESVTELYPRIAVFLVPSYRNINEELNDLGRNPQKRAPVIGLVELTAS